MPSRRFDDGRKPRLSVQIGNDGEIPGATGSMKYVMNICADEFVPGNYPLSRRGIIRRAVLMSPNRSSSMIRAAHGPGGRTRTRSTGEEAVGADRPGGRDEVGGPGRAQGVRAVYRLPHPPRGQRGEVARSLARSKRLATQPAPLHPRSMPTGS